VQRQHVATHAAGLGAGRDAVADGAPPRFAVDEHPAGTSGHVARLLE
jgi:hypothetical protein